MIDPAVAIEDVDPAAFAHLNEVLSRRDRAAAATSKTIVHDGVEALGDLDALRQEHGVDELVLLDRRGLDDLSAQLVEAARQTDDQGELLARCRQVYVNHPAVSFVPVPPAEGPGAWGAVQQVLDSVPDGQWVRAEAGAWVLAAQVREGRIVRITSEPPEGSVNAVSLRGAVSDFDAVLAAEDPLAELRDGVADGRLGLDMGEGIAWPG